jgi:hypothetical protein
MRTIRAEEIPPDALARPFLDSLDVSNEEFVYESNGSPRLVLVPATTLEQRERAKERLFLLIDNIRRRNPDSDSDEILEELESMDRDDDSRRD